MDKTPVGSVRYIMWLIFISLIFFSFSWNWPLKDRFTHFMAAVHSIAIWTILYLPQMKKESSCRQGECPGMIFQTQQSIHLILAQWWTPLCSCDFTHWNWNPEITSSYQNKSTWNSITKIYTYILLASPFAEDTTVIYAIKLWNSLLQYFWTQLMGC